ncbi:hypothetical protein L2E82_34375 [Cichorium intybus]|uniref:Uncharacterized protein n=1 Tax=Cichorium intybus TaxID=13427 RepID=A0ACB9BM41_CICIN|nr:hypothetical protein L2E82_34375 [Cichorium intybus]
MSFPASVCSVWAAGRPPGYAFVDFDVKIDAQDAIPLEQRTHRRILCEIMIGNEFRFFLSCDIKLPVTFRIEKLEGHLPSTNFPNPVEIGTIVEDKKPELYVECALYIDGAPFGLPMRTRMLLCLQIKELNSYVALRKTYQSTLGNKRVELFDMGAGVSEPMADDNDQVASEMSNQELLQADMHTMNETDQVRVKPGQSALAFYTAENRTESSSSSTNESSGTKDDHQLMNPLEQKMMNSQRIKKIRNWNPAMLLAY